MSLCYVFVQTDDIPNQTSSNNNSSDPSNKPKNENNSNDDGNNLDSWLIPAIIVLIIVMFIFVVTYSYYAHKKDKEKAEIMLEHGSLLLMRGATQSHWEHSLPVMKLAKTARINLTFRTIMG